MPRASSFGMAESSTLFTVAPAGSFEPQLALAQAESSSFGKTRPNLDQPSSGSSRVTRESSLSTTSTRTFAPPKASAKTLSISGCGRIATPSFSTTQSDVHSPRTCMGSREVGGLRCCHRQGVRAHDWSEEQCRCAVDQNDWFLGQHHWLLRVGSRASVTAFKRLGCTSGFGRERSSAASPGAHGAHHDLLLAVAFGEPAPCDHLVT